MSLDLSDLCHNLSTTADNQGRVPGWNWFDMVVIGTSIWSTIGDSGGASVSVVVAFISTKNLGPLQTG
jgi:hypothetical protein